MIRARGIRRCFPALVAFALVAGLAAAGCSGARTAAAGRSPSASPTPSASPPPVRRPVVRRPARPVSPLTGRPVGLGRPVLVVKIDNTLPAHPQVGLNAADVVYLEPVEAGLTRLAAVYSSRLPTVVGPVRSIRENDIELFGAYGHVALGASGGNRGVLRQVGASALVDLSFDTTGAGWYFRGDVGSTRFAPYNMFLQPRRLMTGRRGLTPVHDVGFRFGPAARGGRTAPGASVRFSARAAVAWRWDGRHRNWRIAMDGSPSIELGGAPVAATNLIVQYVRVRPSRYSDVNGDISPFTATIGTGPTMLFRDGRRYGGRWSRASLRGSTHFTDGHGHDLRLRPGTTWVLLVPLGRGLGPV